MLDDGSFSSFRNFISFSKSLCRTSDATNSFKSNCCQERHIPLPYSALTQAPTANTKGVDGRGQPSDLPTISPPATPLGFEPVTSTLIPLVGLQALLTLLKAIAVRKGAYFTLIVHSPKRPRRTQGELMDVANPPICQHFGITYGWFSEGSCLPIEEVRSQKGSYNEVSSIKRRPLSISRFERELWKLESLVNYNQFSGKERSWKSGWKVDLECLGQSCEEWLRGQVAVLQALFSQELAYLVGCNLDV